MIAEDVEARREASRLLFPPRDDRRRRHDERGPLPRTDKEQGEGLDRLAETHVVGEHTAHAPGREARHPGEAVALIGTEHALERRGHLGLEGAGRLVARHPGSKSRVSVERGLVVHEVREGVEGRHADEAALACLSSHGVHPLKAPAQCPLDLDVLAVAHGDEAPARGGGSKQDREVHRHAVHVGLPAQAEPVARLATVDVDAQVLPGHRPVDGKRRLTRPLDRETLGGRARSCDQNRACGPARRSSNGRAPARRRQ